MSHRSGPPAALLAVLVAVLLAGCAALGAVAELGGRLGDDGFTGVGTSFSSNTAGDDVEVEATGHARLPPDAAVVRAAEITWRTFPRRLDRLVVRVASRTTSYRRDDLTERFGPRDPSLDATTLSDDARSGGRTAAVVAGVVVVVLAVGGTSLTVLLVRRHRRRPPPGPPPSGQSFGPYGAPPRRS